jgi:hypothetical protein
MPAVEQLGGQMMQGQFDSSVLEAMVAHINEHYNQAIASGVKKDTLTEVAEFLKRAVKAIKDLKQHEAQAAQLIQQGQAGPGVPPAAPGVPPQAQPAPQMQQ